MWPTCPSIVFRDLNDVIDGRDAAGNPYWTFVVKDRYFDGYSLTNLPRELAKALGCQPNDETHIRVAGLPGRRRAIRQLEALLDKRLLPRILGRDRYGGFGLVKETACAS